MNVDRVLEGYVVKLGDNVSTDDIIAGRYLHITDPEELASHLFENRPEIRERLLKAKKPVILVAGRGFGYGSSREHAPIALKTYGVKAVLAESFHRIFYRNSVNNGLLVIEVKGMADLVDDGDKIRVDLRAGIIETPRGTIRIGKIPDYVINLILSGGLKEKLRSIASQKSHT